MPTKRKQTKKKKTAPSTRSRSNPPSRPRMQRNPTIQPRIERSLVHAVCGIADPFCSHAYGAKYPDDSSIRTLSFTSHDLATLATDANGNGSVLIWPSYTYLPYFDTTLTGPPETATPGTATVSTNMVAETYRIVSWGFKVRSRTAPLSASGAVRIRAFPYQTGASLGSYEIATYRVTEYMDTPLYSAKELTVVGRRTTQPPELFYTAFDVTPSNVVTGWTASGFIPYAVSLSGGPASAGTALEIEIICHYELTFPDSSNSAFLSTPAPRQNPLVTAAAGVLSSAGASMFDYAAEKVSNQLTNSAVRALNSLATRLGPGASLALLA